MKGLLKFITCGSVDDGKSTLIGHMLYDAKLLFTDQERTLELDSKVGSRDGKIDYSLLLDGLMAEREQGITIDVAYRYFSTERRSFIVADTPGHEEYTRNMAVGASFAELAVILVDATKGILTQTRRHARICALMGIRYFVFAVNKMDFIYFDQTQYRKLEKDIRKLAVELDLEHVDIIPVSATEGDNVTHPSSRTPWYTGKSLLEYLETIEIEEDVRADHFVLPVQRVCRPNHTFRGFQGQISAGSVAVGDAVHILPSGETAQVKSILCTDREVEQAQRGQPITLQLNREVDVSRGCVITKEPHLHIGKLFVATILWMDDAPLVVGKTFFAKVGTKVIPTTVMRIKYKVDIHTGEQLSAKQLWKNEIATCEFALSDKIVFDAFAGYKDLGCFILIDRVTHMTSACGVIEHALRREENISWQSFDITREFRASKMGQTPKTIWFTGLSGAGKSTIANALEKSLAIQGKYTMILDGDNVRMGLNYDLGFTERDRIENIRRLAQVAKLMNDAGLITLVSCISPFQKEREMAREIIGNDSFVEVYVSTPLDTCMERDVKGLYQKAKKGEIPNFTGISSPYEIPERPELTIDTSTCTVEDAVEQIQQALSS